MYNLVYISNKNERLTKIDILLISKKKYYNYNNTIRLKI